MIPGDFGFELTKYLEKSSEEDAAYWARFIADVEKTLQVYQGQGKILNYRREGNRLFVMWAPETVKVTFTVKPNAEEDHDNTN